MTLRDRILFHEIHPVKLETNLGSGIFCLYFLLGAIRHQESEVR